MSKIKQFPLFSVAALALGLAIPATATTVTVDYGPYVDTGWVNSGSLPTTWAAFGPAAGVVTGTLTNTYQAPTGDSTAYAYVGANSYIIGDFADTAVFSLYWGSVDSYNTIAFTDTNGVVTTFGLGGEAIPGLVLDTNTSAHVTFEDTGALWTEVKFTSGGNSFEFDDVSFTGAITPEPASIALLATGLVAIGAGALRRRKK
jgi:hypothetical protein